jgi:TolB-like protein
MNARIKLPSDDGNAETDAVWQSLRQLLSSPEFAKAPRMCALLSFLMEKKRDGLDREITENEIGLAVFRRDPRTYNTALDPVVRVNVGRLRVRLAAYYAAVAEPPAIEISLPTGCYAPLVQQLAAPQSCFRHQCLQVKPLRNLTVDNSTHAFVCGLDEELGSRLFHAFGKTIELHEASACMQSDMGVGQKPLHRLEGSIQVEDKHVRASMRLVDTTAGNIAWLSKFDFRGNLCMSLQDKLASAICAALVRYLVIA